MADPVTLAHGWWLIGVGGWHGVHGDACRGCRRASHGPDHEQTKETRP